MTNVIDLREARFERIEAGSPYLNRPLRSEAEARLDRIIAAHPQPRPGHGWSGLMSIVSDVGSVGFHKRNAAKALKAARSNRPAAIRLGHSASAASAYWLNRAASNRRAAALAAAEPLSEDDAGDPPILGNSVLGGANR